MWTDVFGSVAQTLCRTYNATFGYFPKACLVSAGYPALVFATAVVVVLLTAATIVWRKLRAKRRAGW